MLASRKIQFVAAQEPETRGVVEIQAEGNLVRFSQDLPYHAIYRTFYVSREELTEALRQLPVA